MSKTIWESGWSVGVSAVKTLRNGDFCLRNVSPHSILRIHLNQCRVKKSILLHWKYAYECDCSHCFDKLMPYGPTRV